MTENFIFDLRKWFFYFVCLYLRHLYIYLRQLFKNICIFNFWPAKSSIKKRNSIICPIYIYIYTHSITINCILIMICCTRYLVNAKKIFWRYWKMSWLTVSLMFNRHPRANILLTLENPTPFIRPYQEIGKLISYMDNGSQIWVLARVES